VRGGVAADDGVAAAGVLEPQRDDLAGQAEAEGPAEAGDADDEQRPPVGVPGSGHAASLRVPGGGQEPEGSVRETVKHQAAARCDGPAPWSRRWRLLSQSSMKPVRCGPRRMRVPLAIICVLICSCNSCIRVQWTFGSQWCSWWK